MLLGGTDGAAPAITDRVDYLIPVSASVGCGGRRLDTINLRYDLSRLGQRIQDIAVPSGFDRTVELRVEDPATGDLSRLLAWGKLARPSLSISETESATFTARLDPHLFGKPLLGYPVRKDASDIATLTIERDLVFNPETDHKLYPNRSDLTEAGFGIGVGSYFFADVESLRTQPARSLQGATATRWDLSTAVHRLCWTLNPDETWIANPLLSDLQAICGTQTTLLENLRVKLGTRLPEALDQLLEPHGFTWYVRHTIDTADPAFPVTSTITIIERGQGVSVDLKLQRIGETIDSNLTHADSVDLRWELAERPNVIRGFSALALREGTFELRPAWSPVDDSLTKAELEKEGKEHDRKHADVFRKFVLNEAGDWTGTRDDFAAAIDLEDLFGTTTVPRRRRFRPALTRGKDRQPIGVNGYVVEFAESALYEQVPFAFSVLETECGILFERSVSEKIRAAFLKKRRSVAAGEVPEPFIRITCCIEGDFRERATAARRPESPNGADIIRDYDLKTKFHDSRVCSSGPFKSRNYDDRHAAIVSATAATPSVIVITGEYDWLKIGDRIAILDSSNSDGVFTIKTVVAGGGLTTLTVDELIAADSADGTLALLTDEEAPFRALTAHVNAIQAEEDFAPLHASASLFGIDHPEYSLGKIVPSVQTRNLQLDSLALSSATQRHPQIVGLDYRCDGEQQISLHLEQYEGRLKYRVG